MAKHHKYTTTEFEDECVRCSVACALGIPRKRVKHIDPKLPYGRWLLAWDLEIERLGYARELFYPNGENEPEGFWIAGVKDLVWGEDHAIVMKGKKLYYDPAEQRTTRPHKFIDGWRLIPVA